MIFLAMTLAPAHASPIAESTHKSLSIHAKRTFLEPLDISVNQVLQKRSASTSSSAATGKFVRAPSYRVKRAVGGVPESGALDNTLLSRNEKRAIGGVPDSGSDALGKGDPMRRASVMEKRAVGGVSPSGSSSKAETRLVGRAVNSGPRQQQKMGTSRAWRRD